MKQAPEAGGHGGHRGHRRDKGHRGHRGHRAHTGPTVLRHDLSEIEPKMGRSLPAIIITSLETHLAFWIEQWFKVP